LVTTDSILSKNSEIGRLITFSLYCLLDESRLWMRLVAWPRNIA
jgi:hypothetical protein